MSKNIQELLVVFGRIFFSLIFIIAGIDKIINFSQTAAHMASNGIPYAEVMLVISIILELGGGLMVLIGWGARIGALMLFIFMIPVTYAFHSFWTYDPAMATNQMHHFFKNLAMMGAALYIMAYGAGRCSIGRKKGG